MNINATSEKFSVTKGMLDHLTERLIKVENLGIDSVNVRFSKEGKDKKVTIETFVNNKKIEANETNKNLYHAIDIATHSLKESIIKERKKSVDKKRRPVKHEKRNDSNDGLKIKRELVSAKPMSEDEAILQMEALNYQSFLFYNTDTKTPCMFFKRKDESYVLVDTNVEMIENTNYVL